MLSEQQLQSLRNQGGAAEAAAEEISALRFQLQNAKDVNLAVVRRLQADVDKYKKQADSDWRYAVSVMHSAADAQDRYDRINPGEL